MKPKLIIIFLCLIYHFINFSGEFKIEDPVYSELSKLKTNPGTTCLRSGEFKDYGLLAKVAIKNEQRIFECRYSPLTKNLSPVSLGPVKLETSD